MVVRHRLELRHVDAFEECAQPERLRRRRPARTRDQRVARVENHRAAVFHVRGDARARLRLWLRHSSDDRPVDQRIERQFVARRIEPDRLGEFGRGARSEHARQRRQPELRGFVDRRVAGDDIGEARGEGRVHVAIRDRRRVGGARFMGDRREAERADDRKGGDRALAAQGRAAHQPDRNQRVDDQADESGRQKPAAKIDRRRDRERALMHGEGPEAGGASVSPAASAFTARRESRVP